jgi:hypothetical protein
MAEDVKRDPNPESPRKKGFNWRSFLIESIIAIVIFDVIAAIVTWYFILPRLKR